MKEFILAFKKWNVIEGRSTRREYWMYYLLSFVCLGIIGFMLGIIKVIFKISDNTVDAIGDLLSFVFILPSITVAIRRIHDAGKSAGFILFPFYNLYLLVAPSQKGSNRFGPHPHREVE